MKQTRSIQRYRPDGLEGNLKTPPGLMSWVRISVWSFLILKQHQLSRATITAWIGTIRRESTREESAEPFSTKKKQGTYRSGEGGEEPTMWPRIWVTTKREQHKKGEEKKWDGKK